MFNTTSQYNQNRQSVKIDSQEILITVPKEFLFKVINAHLESIRNFRKQRTEKSLKSSTKNIIIEPVGWFTSPKGRKETEDETHERLLKNGESDGNDNYHEYPCKCWIKMENRLKCLLLYPESETTIVLPVSFYKLILEFSAFS